MNQVPAPFLPVGFRSQTLIPFWLDDFLMPDDEEFTPPTWNAATCGAKDCRERFKLATYKRKAAKAKAARLMKEKPIVKRAEPQGSPVGSRNQPRAAK